MYEVRSEMTKKAITIIINLECAFPMGKLIILFPFPEHNVSYETKIEYENMCYNRFGKVTCTQQLEKGGLPQLVFGRLQLSWRLLNDTRRFRN